MNLDKRYIGMDRSKLEECLSIHPLKKKSTCIKISVDDYIIPPHFRINRHAHTGCWKLYLETVYSAYLYNKSPLLRVIHGNNYKDLDVLLEELNQVYKIENFVDCSNPDKAQRFK